MSSTDKATQANAEATIEAAATDSEPRQDDTPVVTEVVEPASSTSATPAVEKPAGRFNIKDVGFALGSSTALILGILGMVLNKSQDEKTEKVSIQGEAIWDTLRAKVDEQAAVINEQTKKLAAMSDTVLVTSTRLEMLLAQAARQAQMGEEQTQRRPRNRPRRPAGAERPTLPRQTPPPPYSMGSAYSGQQQTQQLFSPRSIPQSPGTIAGPPPQQQATVMPPLPAPPVAPPVIAQPYPEPRPAKGGKLIKMLPPRPLPPVQQQQQQQTK